MANDVPATPRTYEPCWVSGYALAQEYREEIGWGQVDPAPDLQEHLASLGIDVGSIAMSPKRLHGLSLVGPSYRPTVRWNTNSRRSGANWSKQMTLAHELCHLFHDWRPSTDFSILSDDSGADWATEARANAFAAELVMPREGVAKLLQGATVDQDRLRRLMRHFGVGVRVASWPPRPTSTTCK